MLPANLINALKAYAHEQKPLPAAAADPRQQDWQREAATQGEWDHLVELGRIPRFICYTASI